MSINFEINCSGDVEFFEYDPKETVKEVLLRFLEENSISEPLSFFTFKVNSQDLSNYLDSPMKNYVSKGAILDMEERPQVESSSSYDSDSHRPKNRLFRKEGLGVKSFCDITKNNTKLRGFSKTAPDWRRICKGLNIYGICKNKRCKAYNKNVIVKLRQCRFDLIEEAENLECPMCEGLVIPKTAGFFMCKYQFEGKKIEGEKVVNFGPITKETHDPNHSVYYDPEGSGYVQFSKLIFNILELY